jgi:transposase
MSVYVGIDVHRKRSQVAVVAGDGKVQLNRNVVNGSEPMLRLIGDLPAGTPVAFESAFGWGWLIELLEDYGFDPHMVHPLRCKAIASARLKNDKVDAAILAQLLRADLLPEAWIAPLEVRQLRALLRHRASLVRLGTQVRNRIHAVAADHGYDRAASYWTGPGRGWLADLDLPPVSREIITDCLASIDALEPVIGRLDAELRQHATADPRVKVLTALPGVGRFTALVILAEIGDITRFGSARKLASWAGLTPTVRGSDLSAGTGISPSRARRGCGGSSTRPRRPPSAPPSSPAPTPPSASGAGTRSPPSRSPANCSPAPATCSPPRLHRHRARRQPPPRLAPPPHTRRPGGSPSPGHARSCGMSRPPAALDHLTEQPGPRTHGHGALPAHRRGAGWVLARPLRQPHRGQHDPSPPARKEPSPLPMISRRSSASSSFVLAAARLRALQQDPSHAATRPAAARKIPNNSQAQPSDSTQVTGLKTCALLTPMALMGAAYSACDVR